MKKLTALLIALILSLSACCACAESVLFQTPYFTLTLPENWIVEDPSLESDESFEDLGLFYADEDTGIAVFTSKMYYERMKDISLWNADEETMQLYVDAILDDYADDDPEYLTTVMAGSIPFVLIKATNEDGEFLYADTMTNGYAIVFYVILVGPDGDEQYPFTDAYIQQFIGILSTFSPVT